MQDSSLMCVMNSSRELDNEFHCASRRQRVAFDDFIQASAFDQLHAEIARTVAFSDLMNRHNARMIQTRRGFGLKTKPFDVRFRCPPPKANDFQCHYAIKTFLACPINNALAAASNLLHQLVVTQFVRHLRASCSINFLMNHPKTRLQHAGGAESFRFVDQNCGSAFFANSQYARHLPRAIVQFPLMYCVKFFQRLRSQYRN